MTAETLHLIPDTTRDVLEPDAVRALDPAFARATADSPVWVYRYHDGETGWKLAIGTHAEPGSGKLSLGGFRIAPESRTSLPGWDADREAVGLAIGMEEKVHWSRLLHVGGPLARQERGKVVGGKCVLHPSADARIGQPRDAELLDWAIACFRDFEATSGIFLTTGQDLGHGRMSDGRTQSLDYLNERFQGSVRADTSVPTAEGNFQLLVGMLRGAGLDPARSRIAMVGAGHIGQRMIDRLLGIGAEPIACELGAATRERLEGMGVRTWPADALPAFLAEPADAVVVNAAGGTLNMATCEAIARNARVQLVCGSENLTMPDARGTDVLLAGRKAFAPTELGGMMGYLTAVEEYLSKRAGVDFDIGTVLDAARRLEVVGREAMAGVVASGWTKSFEQVVHEKFGR
jgi:hypothetical protein